MQKEVEEEWELWLPIVLGKLKLHHVFGCNPYRVPATLHYKLLLAESRWSQIQADAIKSEGPLG